MSSIQVPQAVENLYRDLRDRRLLIPVVALVVALIAVPIVLKSDPPAPVPPPAPAAADAKEAEAAEAAVLAEDTGIRDYRKRLAELEERNPFQSNFNVPEPKDKGGEESASSGGSSAASVPSSDGSESTTSAGGAPVTDTPAVDASTDPVTPTEPDAQTPSLPDQIDAETRFFVARVDVKVGLVHDTKTIEGVRYLDFLPGKKTAIASFIGVREGGDAAVFSISRDVVGTHGEEGSCAPKHRPGCEFLTLDLGEERFLKYEPNGKTYRLKLVDTHIVEVPDPRED